MKRAKTKIKFTERLPETKAQVTIKVVETVKEHLKEVPEITDPQIEELLSLKYVDTDESILSLDDRDLLIEIIGFLYKFGIIETIEFFKLCISRDFLLWENSGFDDQRLKFSTEIRLLQRPPEVTKGAGTCSRCKRDELMIATLQVRSGDEGMTTFFRCIHCGLSWKQ